MLITHTWCESRLFWYVNVFQRGIPIFIQNSVAHFKFWVFDSQTNVNSFILNAVYANVNEIIDIEIFFSAVAHAVVTCVCIGSIDMTFKFGCNFDRFSLRVWVCLGWTVWTHSACVWRWRLSCSIPHINPSEQKSAYITTTMWDCKSLVFLESIRSQLRTPISV